MDRGILVCDENSERIRCLLPDDVAREIAKPLRPAAELTGKYQYTRGIHLQSAPDVQAAESVFNDAEMMIFSGEEVAPGALWVHGFTIRHAGPLDIGALHLALRLWEEEGATIGGMSSRGHGRLDMNYRTDPQMNVNQCVAAYEAAVNAAKDEGIEFLDRLFSRQSAVNKEAADDQAEE